MHFKISHKNKSVLKRIAQFLELFSNHMFILGRINRIAKACSEASSVTQKFVGGKKLEPEGIVFAKKTSGPGYVTPERFGVNRIADIILFVAGVYPCLSRLTRSLRNHSN
jgi:hypothetical protein